MLKPSHLQETPVRKTHVFRFISLLSLTTALLSANPVLADSTGASSMGIRLTILPATSIEPSSDSPFANLENALGADQLNRIEMDSNLAAGFSQIFDTNNAESASDIVDRLEQALENLKTESSETLVVTLSAG